MDLSPIGLARILLPKTPLLLKTAVLNTLYLSPNAWKQDIRTEVTVNLIRELIRKPDAIGKTQNGSLRAPGIKGKMWISKVTLPKPEDGEGLTPRDALDIAIKELGDGNETYTIPETSAVEAEWTGYRSGVEGNASRPVIPEEEHYKHLMSEVKSDVTILYFHGGAHFLMDPATHRIPTSNLARLTSGRCLSIRYRLAPQNPFPSAILDALIAYLSLLSPPPSSLHAPIPSSNIVFAGDSAGGNLSLALLQTLLTLQRKGIQTLRFHGQDVPLSLPAGLALNSPWCDVSRSMPSCRTNANYDYISAPADFSFGEDPPVDEVWPAAPPRIDLYANAPTLTHPLVSPLATKAECWKGAPPVYMCAGNEGLEDEITVVARRMHDAGARVRFDGYEGQPHCFSMIFPQYTPGKECVSEWAGFIRDVVEGKVEVEVPEGGKATWAKALSNPLRRVEVEFAELKKELSDLEVEGLMRSRRERFVEKEEGMVREWREKQQQGQGDTQAKLKL